MRVPLDSEQAFLQRGPHRPAAGTASKKSREKFPPRLFQRTLTFRSIFPQGGQPSPWAKPLRNQSPAKAVTVELQEKTTLTKPTIRRPEEKSQRALIWSERTPLMNLLMAYAADWLLVMRPAAGQGAGRRASARRHGDLPARYRQHRAGEGSGGPPGDRHSPSSSFPSGTSAMTAGMTNEKVLRLK